MESVVIIAPHEYDDVLRLRLEGVSGSSVAGPQPWIVEDGKTRVYVSRNDFVRDELEPEELARIEATMGNPVFYTVDFSDLGLCRKVLEILVNDPKLLVDNDHGVLLSGSELVRMLRSRPDWDWRLDHA